MGSGSPPKKVPKSLGPLTVISSGLCASSLLRALANSRLFWQRATALSLVSLGHSLNSMCLMMPETWKKYASQPGQRIFCFSAWYWGEEEKTVSICVPPTSPAV